MEFKRDPKHGKILRCANDECRKEAFLFEAIDNWAEHKGTNLEKIQWKWK